VDPEDRETKLDRPESYIGVKPGKARLGPLFQQADSSPKACSCSGPETARSGYHDSGVFEELLASVRHYTIAFVSIPESPNDYPWPSDAGTLVTINGSHYFLTAEHVWRALKKSRSVGITLVPEIDQCKAINLGSS
jgi:hypothetical protein